MQKSGFFNALNIDGIYDRKYNANDYCDNLAVVISNGVLRSENDDLKTTADGMAVTVGVGRAWINGHYYYNDTPHTFAATTAPAGGKRYDRVILRLDTDISARSIELVYREGVAANTPAKPAIIRNDTVCELVLADIFVDTNATSVIVTDTRADKTVCGWVYSTSGDNSFFESLDADFHEWFTEKKDTLSSVTLFKRYEWRTQLDGAANTVAFNIPQYDAETGFIDVFVNGLIVTENVDYTLNGNVITFSNSLVSGTEILVRAFKSIDGTGIMSVADEITEIQNRLANINAANNYFYNCNGVNDNVIISQMAQDFINASTEAGELTITVVGNFGATAPVKGDGTTSTPYIWFNIGSTEILNRRVTLDFSGCSVVNLTHGDGIYCTFSGRQYAVKNLCLNINGTQSTLYGQPMYYGTKGVYFENCRINAAGLNGWLFNYGTFRDCEITVKTNSPVSTIFKPASSDDMLRIYGGVYTAYTSDTSGVGTVVYCSEYEATSAIIVDGISCPTKSENGYRQTHAVYDLATGDYHKYLNIISALPVSAAGQTVRDTIVASR